MSITRAGPTSGVVNGDLTLNGLTKPATLTARWDGPILNPIVKTPISGISATGTIRRSEFGNTAFMPTIGDEVQFEIEAEYDKQ